MDKCSVNNHECSGEVHKYYYRLSEAEEIILENKAFNLGKTHYRGYKVFDMFCDVHKKGEIYIQKPMRPSLPYQGIARRALK